MKCNFKIEDGEYWWGVCVNDGSSFPLGKDSLYCRDITLNDTGNQANPLLLSNNGKYIWDEKGFNIEVKNGEMTILGDNIISGKSGDTLKSAYREASLKFFPPCKQIPNLTMFENPQYCTWIELKYNQTQEGILNYANSIIQSGMPVGEIIIDDGWMKYYGHWDFDKDKFYNAKLMIKKLHQMGFKVILWICNYISADSKEFRFLNEENCLVKNDNQNYIVRQWWNGSSAILDITNPRSVEWFYNQTDYLIQKYEIDGFKMDAGDANIYKSGDIFYDKKACANDISHKWSEMSLRYSFNELRAGFLNANKGISQRLCDKKHSWDEKNGLRSLIPNVLNAGIIGYPYICPDMIGGGSFTDFYDYDNLDKELLIRWCECSSLMPMMQFSLNIWQDKIIGKKVVEYALLHKKYGKLLKSLAEHASITGEPIARSMEYVFPHCGFEKITNQFLIGNELLVAPILEKNKELREVKLPVGKWKYIPDGKIYSGNIIVNADIYTLPYFERI